MKTQSDPIQAAMQREDLVAAYVGALNREDAETVAKVRAVAKLDPVLAGCLNATLNQYKAASDTLAEYERECRGRRSN